LHARRSTAILAPDITGAGRGQFPGPGKEIRMATEAYCVKCRAKKVMKDEQAVTMKNGKPATQGVCPDCGTKMFKIGKSK
jgi:Zn finger protein HypA/HybF involved in hydrogenase expression